MSLALADAVPRQQGSYSTRQASKLTKLSQNQIRNIVYRGLLAPSRGSRSEYLFSFQDIAFLRSLQSLQSDSVSMRKILNAMCTAKQKLRARQAVVRSKFNRVGDQVLIQEHTCLWDPVTDRLQLDFDREPGSTKTNIVDIWMRDFQLEPSSSMWDERASDSDDWYNLGIEWERLDVNEAATAYRKALKLDAENIDAYVNLGRLTQMNGDLNGAMVLYNNALEVDPVNELAHYNMGTIYDEMNQLDEAIGQYTQALGIADAHFNLSQLYADLGDELRARRYMVSFERLRDRIGDY